MWRNTVLRHSQQGRALSLRLGVLRHKSGFPVCVLVQSCAASVVGCGLQLGIGVRSDQAEVHT